MLLWVEEKIQKMLLKVRWIIDWFFYTDYTSGEMIRTWFVINDFCRTEKWWRKHMKRKMDARYN